MSYMLAIETSADACSVALLIQREGRPDEIFSSHEIRPMQQAKLLLTHIQRLLNQASVKLDELNAIAYGCGPGSFTGLRLVTSVVQGIGYIHKIPVIAVSSLVTLAQTAYLQSGWERVVVAKDARQHQLYFAAYKLGKQGLMESVGEELLISPNELDMTGYDGWYGMGDAFGIYAEDIKGCPAITDKVRAPTAQAMLDLAKPKFANKEWISASDALPVYLNPFKR